MSFTRSAWKREYVFGDSHLYSFIGTDGNLWFFGKGCNDAGFEVILKEDAFEFVLSLLNQAGIDLTKVQTKKLAKELNVRLRKRPLTFEEMSKDMERRARKK